MEFSTSDFNKEIALARRQPLSTDTNSVSKGKGCSDRIASKYFSIL
jgi:hypothetical protein